MIQIKSFTFSPIQENTYILYNEQGKAIIIDPGCYTNVEHETLKNFIKKEELTPIQLLNTHCHLDHVFGNRWVADQFGLELWIHPLEQPVLAYAPLAGEKWGMPFENYAGAIHFLEEGDKISFGHDILEVILCPGHSPGSICFYIDNQQILIGGDVLFRESIGRTDLPGGDHDTLLKNIREKLFILPDAVQVYSGHGPATTIGHEKMHNPFVGQQGY